MSGRSTGVAAILRGAVVALLAFGVGFSTLRHGLVFDDHQLLGGNAPVIRGEEPLLSAFTYRYWGGADEASPNELYRPATIASLALNARLLGGEPWSFHAGNLSLHAANALLVFLLVGTLFARQSLALLAGLLFSLHPIATEAVAPISGRADLLSTFFVLMGAVMALTSIRRRDKWAIPCGLGVAACAFFGALSKESAYAMPLLLAGVVGSDRGRHAGTARENREYRLAAGGFALFAVLGLIAALILRVRILGYLYQFDLPDDPSTAALSFVNNPLQTAPPLGRVLTALRVAVMGAGLLVFPWQLSADYSFNQIPVTLGWPTTADCGAVAFVILYLGLVYWTSRRFPVAFFGLTWAAVSYLIVSNLLFPIGTIFGERLLYLPLAGFATLTASGLSRLLDGSRRSRALAMALATVMLGLAAARFVARCDDWRDDETLFAATIKASPNSAKAHSNRGFTLQQAGRPREAADAYGRALEIAPGMTGTGISLARTLAALGRSEEAVSRYQDVVAKDPGISIAWSGLGLAQDAAGHAQEAEASFRRALQLSLGANLEAIMGLAAVMSRTDREQEAVDLVARTARGKPHVPSLQEALGQAHYMVGVRRLKEGDRAAFIAAMQECVARDPLHGPAQFNLSVDALERGDAGAARAHASQAAQAHYDFPDGYLRAVGLTAPSLGPAQ